MLRYSCSKDKDQATFIIPSPAPGSRLQPFFLPWAGLGLGLGASPLPGHCALRVWVAHSHSVDYFNFGQQSLNCFSACPWCTGACACMDHHLLIIPWYDPLFCSPRGKMCTTLVHQYTGTRGYIAPSDRLLYRYRSSLDPSVRRVVHMIINGLLVCNALIYIFSSLRFLDLCMSPLQATLHVVARQSVQVAWRFHLVGLGYSIAYRPRG